MRREAIAHLNRLVTGARGVDVQLEAAWTLRRLMGEEIEAERADAETGSAALIAFQLGLVEKRATRASALDTAFPAA